MDNPLFPNQEHQKNHDAVMKSAQTFASDVDAAVQAKFDENRFNNDQYLGAGVGLYRAVQQFRTTDMGEEAQSRLAQAADKFGAIWAEQHGLQGVKISSAVTFDRNGEPHVRLYQGDDNFVTDFSYDNMEKYLRKHGYLDEVDKQLKGELGLFDQKPEETAPSKTKMEWDLGPVDSLITYAGSAKSPGQRKDRIILGLNQLVKDGVITEKEKYKWLKKTSDPEYWAEAQASGGGTSSGGSKANSGAAGFADDSASTSTANSKDSGKTPSTKRADAASGVSAIADFADEVESEANGGKDNSVQLVVDNGKKANGDLYESGTPVEPSGRTPEGDASLASANAKMNPSAMVGQYDVSTKEGLDAAQKQMEANGYNVRKIGDEWYAWIPGAGVWVAGDGHTVREKNGTFVDTGWEPGMTKVLTKNPDVTLLTSNYDTTNESNKTLHAGVDRNGKQIRKPRHGAAGEMTATKIEGTDVTRRVNDNIIRFLQAKNNAEGLGEESLNSDSGVARTTYQTNVAKSSRIKDGKVEKVDENGNVISRESEMGTIGKSDKNTTKREEARIGVFESGPNGAKGVDTFARRLNGSAHLNDGLRSRGITISPAATEFKAYKDGAEISEDEYMKAVMEIEFDAAKDIVSQFEGLSDKDKTRLLDNLSEAGVINLTYAEKYLNAKAGDEKRRKQMEVLNDAWLDIGKRREESILALGVGLRTQVENIASIKDAETRDRAAAEFLQSLSAEDAKKVKDCMEAVEEYDKALDALNKAGIKTKKIPKKDVKPKSVQELGSQPEATA